MEKFLYRMATLEDLPLIIETMKKIVIERGWKVRDLLDVTESQKENDSFLMEEGTLLVCLAYNDNIFVGMGGMYDWNRARTAEGEASFSTGYFYTVPEYRKQGVMHRIAEILIQTARERGCGRVNIFIGNEYRKSLYEMGFRDIIDIDEGGIFVKGDEMEIPNSKWRGNYNNLQPLRIPAGWSIICNKLEDIELENISDWGDEMELYSDDDFGLFYIRSEVSYESNGKTKKQKLDIILEWEPDDDTNGKFVLQAILDRDWFVPLLYFSSRSKDEIVQTLEKWLFVEFMPRCFIDEDVFHRNHKLPES